MKIRVAIVEDKKETLDWLKSIVESSDELWCSEVFQSAEAFLKKIRAYHLELDVVLMDIELKGGMSGIACISELRQENKGVKFLMCTDLEDTERIYNALRAGALGYVVKSEGAEKIIAAIKDLYAGGGNMSPQIAKKVMLTFQTEEKNEELLNKLTAREFETIELIAKGFPYKVVADKLHVTEYAIKNRIATICEKLQAKNKAEIIAKLSSWLKF